MTGVEEQMQVILVTDIGCKQGAVEVGDALVAEITSGVGVIEVEADVQTLTRINGKDGIDMILTVDLITAVVVKHSCVR